MFFYMPPEIVTGIQITGSQNTDVSLNQSHPAPLCGCLAVTSSLLIPSFLTNLLDLLPPGYTIFTLSKVQQILMHVNHKIQFLFATIYTNLSLIGSDRGLQAADPIYAD